MREAGSARTAPRSSREGRALAPFTTLLAAHAGVPACHLAAALQSLEDQDMPARETVLVCDGPLADAQMAVIDLYCDRLQAKVLELPQQRGLAEALNAGLTLCGEPYVARMDSDDIAVPHRFAKQARALSEQPDVDLLASWHVEFSSDPAREIAIKRAPRDHSQLVRRLKWRNVLSHPTIVVRRSVLADVGGYRDLHLLEDYDLYMRLIAEGATLACLPEALVKVRVSHEQRARRGGRAHLRSEWQFRRESLRRGNLSLVEWTATNVLYTGWRAAPAKLRGALYPLVRTRAEGRPE